MKFIVIFLGKKENSNCNQLKKMSSHYPKYLVCPVCESNKLDRGSAWNAQVCRKSGATKSQSRLQHIRPVADELENLACRPRAQYVPQMFYRGQVY